MSLSPVPDALDSAPSYELTVLPGELAVCRLTPDASLPGWAGTRGLWAAIRTPDELCVVCADGDVPKEVTAEHGWAALQVKGPLEFSQVGVMAALASALATAGVSLFALSTYDTDYLLVKGECLRDAVAALRRAGHRVDWPSGGDW